MTLHDSTNGGGPLRRGLPRFAFALLLLAACTGRVFAAAPAAGRIVLVSVDGLPAGRAGASSLPALDALGPHAVSEIAAPGPLAFPCAATLLTGASPSRTGVRDEISRGLPATVPTLAAALTSAGWRSLALPADTRMHAGTGLARGFTRGEMRSPAWSDSARVDTALAWLAEGPRRFVWIALSFGPPPEAWRRMDGIGPADPAAATARAREIDAALARLGRGLASLGPVTWVVVGGAAPPPAEAGAADRPVLLVWSAPAPARPLTRLEDVAPALAAAAGARLARPATPPAASAAGELARTMGSPAQPDSARARLAALRAILAEAEPESLRTQALNQLLARAPDAPRVALELSLQQARIGRNRLALDLMKGMLRKFPDYPEAAIAYADQLTRTRGEDQVRAALEPIAPDSPAAAEAAWRWAIALARQEDFVAAEGAADRASALAVPTPALLGAAPTLRELGRRKETVRLAPQDSTARLEYAAALADFGLYDPAYAQLHAARGLMPHSAEPDYRMAKLLLDQGRPQHAAPTLERGLQRDSTHVASWMLLADARLELGRTHDARVALERGLGSGARVVDARSRYNLACLRAAEGDASGAFAALAGALDDGWNDSARLDEDPDLAALRSDPRWPALRSRLPR